MMRILDERYFLPSEVEDLTTLSADALLRIARHHPGTYKKFGKNYYLAESFFSVGLDLTPEKARTMIEMLSARSERTAA